MSPFHREGPAVYRQNRNGDKIGSSVTNASEAIDTANRAEGGNLSQPMSLLAPSARTHTTGPLPFFLRQAESCATWKAGWVVIRWASTSALVFRLLRLRSSTA